MQDVVSLDGKTIIITGAAQGIGRAATELAIRLGGRVAAIDMNAEGVESLAAGAPDRIFPFVGSVADPQFAQMTVDAIAARLGDIHGLVNNAGITRPAMIEKMSMQAWNDVIAVHLTGAFIWTQAVGRKMLESAKSGAFRGGSIINISSDAGRMGSIGQINYAAAKAGMLGMTMTAAREWGKFNIRSNAICFGLVETPMTEVVRSEKFRDTMLAQIPMGRWAQPEEVVKTVCFLLSDAASYITGQNLAVNGGFHITL